MDNLMKKDMDNDKAVHKIRMISVFLSQIHSYMEDTMNTIDEHESDIDENVVNDVISTLKVDLDLLNKYFSTIQNNTNLISLKEVLAKKMEEM